MKVMRARINAGSKVIKIAMRFASLVGQIHNKYWISC